MKITVDIQDNKVDTFLRMLKSVPYVKSTKLKSSKKKFLEEFKEAIDNLNLVKQGKLKARDARELLDEL